MGGSKGSGFEREIAKQLGLWWTHGERDDIFWRTSQSGGRATVRRQKGKSTANQDGDLCATDPIGQPLINKTTIELKVGYNGWTIKELIDSKRKCLTTLEQFFSQASREAENQEKDCWWLITRQDRRNTIIFMNHKFWKWLKPRVQFPEAVTVISILHPQFGPVHCMTLELFLNIVEPELFNEEQ